MCPTQHPVRLLQLRTGKRRTPVLATPAGWSLLCNGIVIFEDTENCYPTVRLSLRTGHRPRHV